MQNRRKIDKFAYDIYVFITLNPVLNYVKLFLNIIYQNVNMKYMKINIRININIKRYKCGTKKASEFELTK